MVTLFATVSKLHERKNTNWLVVWIVFYFPFHIRVVIRNPLTNSYFSEGVGIPPTSQDLGRRQKNTIGGLGGGWKVVAEMVSEPPRFHREFFEKWSIWKISRCLTGLTFFWVNYNDLTVLPHWKSWLVRGIIPKWPQDSGWWIIIIYPYFSWFFHGYVKPSISMGHV